MTNAHGCLLLIFFKLHLIPDLDKMILRARSATNFIRQDRPRNYAFVVTSSMIMKKDAFT